MSFKLQQIPSESKLCQHLRVQILEQCYPRELVSSLLTSCHAWEQRERKLTQLVIVYDIMALALFRQCNVTEVFAHLSRGLRWLWPDDTISLPTGGALTARRQSLGSIVLRRLFRQCCRTLASEATKGAFALGLRLMAVDGTLDEVPDTPANALHFGRLTTGKSQSPFPQVRCLYLAEVGTHAIVDAVLARCKSSEHTLAQVLLRSIHQGMLVMTDRNFVSVKWLTAVPQRGAQVLSRLATGVFTKAGLVPLPMAVIWSPCAPKAKTPSRCASSSIACIPSSLRIWPSYPFHGPRGQLSPSACIGSSPRCWTPCKHPPLS